MVDKLVQSWNSVSTNCPEKVMSGIGHIGKIRIYFTNTQTPKFLKFRCLGFRW